MPVSVHTDDNPSPRTELLSRTTSSPAPQTYHSHSQSHSQSQSQSPVSPRNRHRNNTRSNGKSHSSRNWWKERERELLHANYSPRDLVRMVIEAEKETTKLHDTLTNTISLLDEESKKCANLERDSVSTFTRLNLAREAAQATAEGTARDLRVAQFELEHARREIERLKDELEVQKRMREETEAEVAKFKDVAYRFRQERIMDRAREDGRREGFEAGFMKAQQEHSMRMQMRAEAASAAAAAAQPLGRPHPGPVPGPGPSAPMPEPRHRADTSRIPTENYPGPEVNQDDNESIYQELDSVPIITPPQGTHTVPDGQTVPMRTGYSPTRRPARWRSNAAPERHSPTPSVDHYAISIPPQDVIERTQNIHQPPRAEWVTGQQYRDIHGHTPPIPSSLMVNSNSTGAGLPGPSGAETPTSVAPSAKPRVKFRRPTLAKTKQTAASWYRSLSFRKKPKQKIVIDPDVEDEGRHGEASNSHAVSPTTPTATDEAGPSGVQESNSAAPPPIIVRPSSRHSRAASASSAIRARDYAYPSGAPTKGQGHRRAASIDSVSTHTSQFDLLTAPGMSMSSGGGGYSRGGPANASVGSLGSVGLGLNGGVGKTQSASGRSARSGAGTGITKKLSVIKETPSRDTTPVKPTHQHEGPSQSHGSQPLTRQYPYTDDLRSMKSGKSASSRMVAMNPDPASSPEWANQSQRQVYGRPPSDSALMRPAATMSNSSLVPGQGTAKPPRTNGSGLMNVGGNGSGVGMDTPTPLPRISKGKEKEKAVPGMIGEDLDLGVGGSGHESSPGIGIDVQTPSDGVRFPPGHQNSQNENFLSPRHSSNSLPQHSTPRHSVATSTTKVAGPTSSPQGFPRSISPIPRSSPKIFLAQGLPNAETNGAGGGGEEIKRPRMTVLGHVKGMSEGGGGGAIYTSNAGMTPGPMLYQPLPSRGYPQQGQGVGGGPGLGPALEAGLGADLHQAKLHRAGSSSSLRSQEPYSKFDASTYEDPAIWAAPPGAFEKRPTSRASSRRLSYADP